MRLQTLEAVGQSPQKLLKKTDPGDVPYQRNIVREHVRNPVFHKTFEKTDIKTDNTYLLVPRPVPQHGK